MLWVRVEKCYVNANPFTIVSHWRKFTTNCARWVQVVRTGLSQSKLKKTPQNSTYARDNLREQIGQFLLVFFFFLWAQSHNFMLEPHVNNHRKRVNNLVCLGRCVLSLYKVVMKGLNTDWSLSGWSLFGSFRCYMDFSGILASLHSPKTGALA